jgi:hypothetical protein
VVAARCGRRRPHRSGARRESGSTRCSHHSP